MLWNSTSWSRLKLSVQIQLAFYPCDPFLTNNCSMTGNSVEKCFVVLNVKLEVKLWFKTFYWLQNLLRTASALNATTFFVYELFLSPNISDFSLFFFFVKLQPTLKKVTSSFPAAPPSKRCDRVRPPSSFRKFGRSFNVPAERVGCILWLWIINMTVMLSLMGVIDVTMFLIVVIILLIRVLGIIL